MASQADRALKFLLRDKRLFVACYTPSKSLPSIDFTTGIQSKTNSITFTQGAILSKTEIPSFVKDRIVTGSNESYLIIEDNKVEIDLATRIVIHGLTYNVKKVFDSFYSKWNLLIVTRATDEQIMSAEVKDLYASDQAKAYLDWLVNEVKILFAGTIPDDLLLWPIAGFSVEESLKYIYPVGGSVPSSGELYLREVGRLAGYSGTGLIDGAAPKKVTQYAQTNYDSVIPLIEQFNTYMGRL